MQALYQEINCLEIRDAQRKAIINNYYAFRSFLSQIRVSFRNLNNKIRVLKTLVNLPIYINAILNFNLKLYSF